MFDTPILPRLQQLLEEMKDGALQIPMFQRSFIWDDDQRLRLLDSVYRGIPIGSLLVWRTTKHPDLQSHKSFGRFKVRQPPSETTQRTYLLDGLQRLTTLYAALASADLVSDEPTGGDDHDVDDGRMRWPIYFELQEPEKASDLRFKLLPRGRNPPPTWLPLSCVFDPEALFKFQRSLFDQGLGHLTSTSEKLVGRFKDYLVPVLPLVVDDLDVVTDAFARVNSSGTEVSEADMVRALTWTRTFDLDDQFDAMSSSLEPVGWSELRKEVLLNTLKAVADIDLYNSDPTAVEAALKRDRDALLRLREPLLGVIELLNSWGVRGPRALPYAYQLVGLVRVATLAGLPAVRSANSRVRSWFFQTAYAGHFTGMTAAQLRGSFAHLAEVVAGTADPAPELMETTVAPLTRFSGKAVRTQLFALRMAIAGDASAGASELTLLYGQRGTEAVLKLVPGKSAEHPGNRVIAEAEDLAALRAMLGPAMLPLTEEQLALSKKHMIPLNAIEARKQGGDDAFLTARGKFLEAEEAKWVQTLGMKLKGTFLR